MSRDMFCSFLKLAALVGAVPAWCGMCELITSNWARTLDGELAPAWCLVQQLRLSKTEQQTQDRHYRHAPPLARKHPDMAIV